MEQLFQWLDSFKSANMVRAAFGDPYTVDDHTVIPVSRVRFGFGAGGRPGHGRAESGSIGSGGMSKPLAIVTIGPNGVEVREIKDRTRIAITGMALLALVIFMAWQLLNNRYCSQEG